MNFDMGLISDEEIQRRNNVRDMERRDDEVIQPLGNLGLAQSRFT